ncbi:UNVERIFIED_CONTAM: hypothetical protein Sangu_3227200 [Sesamum angustifolium]|uniref:Uncharacterized protein n=1 Tax=Sesamum angustifolium TaxID=2727405 RepID=A0AAW2JK61_9LAMI
MAFTYSPVCFRLINMADHNRAGNPPFCLKLVHKRKIIAIHAPPSLRLWSAQNIKIDPYSPTPPRTTSDKPFHIQKSSILASRVPTNAFDFA